MISFDAFRAQNGLPIYLQILRYIKRGIVCGDIADGDALPSRRMLSAMLGVNPNTVQKAYHLLEGEGLIVSQIGAKSYVSLDPEALQSIRAELLESEIRSVISALDQMGLRKEEALMLIEKYWPRGEN